jgi:hypothetical protein
MVEAGKTCLFVPKRLCSLEVDEIPLDVCRLCLEAWKAYIGYMMVRRPHARAEELAPSIHEETAPPLQAEPVRAGRKSFESLQEIDRHFMNGELTLQDYLMKRKEAVKRLQEAIP